MSELILYPTEDDVEFDTFGTTEMIQQLHKQDAEGFMWSLLDASRERRKGDDNAESEDEDEDEDEDEEE
jgi:hypothetical protein